MFIHGISFWFHSYPRSTFRYSSPHSSYSHQGFYLQDTYSGYADGHPINQLRNPEAPSIGNRHVILIGLNNKNPKSDIRGWKLKDQRSRTSSHLLLPLQNPQTEWGIVSLQVLTLNALSSVSSCCVFLSPPSHIPSCFCLSSPGIKAVSHHCLGLFLVYADSISRSPEWPWTHRDPSASIFWGLRLKVCTTTA